MSIQTTTDLFVIMSLIGLIISKYLDKDSEIADLLTHLCHCTLFIGCYVCTICRHGVVVSGSMEPALETDKDLAFFSPLPYQIILPLLGKVYTTGKPARGDIICFDTDSITLDEDTISAPLKDQIPSAHMSICKRVIGVEGDTILVINGIVYVNSIPLRKEDISSYYDPEQYSTTVDFTERIDPGNGIVSFTTRDYRLRNEYYYCVVPENHVFTMGDNRAVSLDSRIYGPVSLDKIQSKFIFKLHYAV